MSPPARIAIFRTRADSNLFVRYASVHIDPADQMKPSTFVIKPSKNLPPGKSAYDVWGDCLGKLGAAAKEAAAQEWAITWIPELERRRKVRYIIAIPVAWQKGEFVE